jgi:hypothetical protein
MRYFSPGTRLTENFGNAIMGNDVNARLPERLPNLYVACQRDIY